MAWIPIPIKPWIYLSKWVQEQPNWPRNEWDITNFDEFHKISYNSLNSGPKIIFLDSFLMPAGGSDYVGRDGGAHHDQQQMMNRFIVHCLVATLLTVTVAPGISVREEKGGGWALTLDGDIVMHCHCQMSLLDVAHHVVHFMVMDVVEERGCGLLLMSKLNIGVCQYPFWEVIKSLVSII